ncbi:hypothetical protein F4821DRAFT_258025 [Hypoxylon rubiginosum]|uniref:Uncharacterized protein n=1 Tax=Hypoxylon rubiginosum TaxID=110542 RepID=A0ACC0D7K4_9PEZI|nr:hypothetical protein F4821DRAFT_258025 [Hypoxylon rubiginosum]
MKPTSITCAATLASVVSAGCFTTGQSWGADKQKVIDLMKQRCNMNFNADGLKGVWDKPGNGVPSRTVRFNLDNGRYARLTLTRIGDGGTDGNGYIKQGDCVDGLTKEINGCEHGGGSLYTNWEYKGDINKSGTDDDGP